MGIIAVQPTFSFHGVQAKDDNEVGGTLVMLIGLVVRSPLACPEIVLGDVNAKDPMMVVNKPKWRDCEVVRWHEKLLAKMLSDEALLSEFIHTMRHCRAGSNFKYT